MASSSDRARVIMLQGTASSVGKSVLVAGLCRLLARRGLRVAPFKAQNMSNNAAVTADGGEIGRAQFVQALAAGIQPSVDMNPILLKPQADTTSQLIVLGQRRGLADFSRPARDLWQVVAEALDRLRQRHELIVVEGAGSPAEINLRDRDLANMQLALHAWADVLLVGDIDRGGVFAALLGTYQWLAPQERALLRGFILNKFRGDPTLLHPAPALLTERTGVPVLGVVPWLADLQVPEEDAASLTELARPDAMVEIAAVRLPHLANFDELQPLAAEPGVQLRWVTRPDQLRAPDLVILPGSKATVPDLVWLAERGLAARLRWLAEHDTPLLGICGGFQMLGDVVTDPLQLESSCTAAPGLRLLPIRTELTSDKRLARVQGRFASIGSGLWGALAGAPIDGYEIHLGRSVRACQRPLLELGSGPDGLVSASGEIAGTYVHGVFEGAPPRRRLIEALAARRGFLGLRPLPSADGSSVDPYDRLADVLDASLDLQPLGL